MFLVLFCSYLLVEPNLATNTLAIEVPDIPTNSLKLARYIIHNVDWVSVATISTQEGIKDYPFASVESVADGTASNGTGIPFLYLTGRDMASKDAKVNDRVTIVATLAQTNYCSSNNYDPEDPRCPKVMITGRFVTVSQSDSDHEFGKEALFEKHPSMRHWPTNHGFYVAKVNIEQVLLMSKFGGYENIPVNDYLNAN